MNKAQFENFIAKGRLDQNGKPLFMTSAELKALNDLCRSEILNLRGKTNATAPDSKPAATVAPAAASKTAPAASKPAAAVSTARTLTAAEWQAQNAPPTMSRAEWQKLDPRERGAFFQKGGKLAP